MSPAVFQHPFAEFGEDMSMPRVCGRQVLGDEAGGVRTWRDGAADGVEASGLVAENLGWGLLGPGKSTCGHPTTLNVLTRCRLSMASQARESEQLVHVRGWQVGVCGGGGRDRFRRIGQ
ncbi:hypothetical protein [Streptomyces sp. NPDC055005]